MDASGKVVRVKWAGRLEQLLLQGTTGTKSHTDKHTSTLACMHEPQYADDYGEKRMHTMSSPLQHGLCRLKYRVLGNPAAFRHTLAGQQVHVSGCSPAGAVILRRMGKTRFERVNLVGRREYR
ncbi:unnamed protein product [Protopolystoma xenopodis]|uniref:Uncharacterized protein n=1 Tax=Protopolystoma xenopodis TaxID=117903 RepID=A0A3S5FBK8_9PLAT|nr:unnamed protein product [Protopolystoma xenopodis]